MKTRGRGRGADAIATRAAEGLQELLDSADELLQSVRDEQGEAVDALRAKVGATTRRAARQLADLRQSAGSLGRDAARRGVSFVRRDPWRGVALGAITLLGFTLLMRRADD